MALLRPNTLTFTMEEVSQIAMLLQLAYKLKENSCGQFDELLQDFIAALEGRATIIIAD